MRSMARVLLVVVFMFVAGTMLGAATLGQQVRRRAIPIQGERVRCLLGRITHMTPAPINTHHIKYLIRMEMYDTLAVHVPVLPDALLCANEP